MDDQIPRLEALAGEQLSSVIFVADYVQFDFNGPILTAISNPTVVHGSSRLQFPASGSRDALCSLIQQDVASVVEVDEDRIEVTFHSGDCLLIPLDQASYRGPEAATFSHPKVAGLRVW
jgi:hypothetical protein